jgi:hypothetical protein
VTNVCLTTTLCNVGQVCLNAPANADVMFEGILKYIPVRSSAAALGRICMEHRLCNACSLSFFQLTSALLQSSQKVCCIDGIHFARARSLLGFFAPHGWLTCSHKLIHWQSHCPGLLLSRCCAKVPKAAHAYMIITFGAGWGLSKRGHNSPLQACIHCTPAEQTLAR